MRFVPIFLILLFIPTLASATSCYSAKEAEAEQAIRIHSELMIIGLNCQHMGKRIGMNLYGDYKHFTARHGTLFANYEKALLRFYRRRGDSKPEASLNTLRTGFANKISEDVASMRPDVFCAAYAQRMEHIKSMSETDLRKWAATPFQEHPVSYPICGT
jgi:hypothetical protein